MASAITGTPFRGGAGPEQEGEQVVNLTVQIRGYGKPSQVQREVLTEVGRALTHTFGAGRHKMFLGGRRVVFDAQAFDAQAFDGEHIGHDVVLAVTDERFKPAG